MRLSAAAVRERLLWQKVRSDRAQGQKAMHFVGASRKQLVRRLMKGLLLAVNAFRFESAHGVHRYDLQLFIATEGCTL